MILRSRMNKNILIPLISCIMIIFTLLYLLQGVQRDLNWYKEQYKSTLSQLQNVNDIKLRLEKSLENEKTEGKQKLDKIQSLLDLEKEDRLKEKNEANMKYDSQNEKYDSLQTVNTDLKDQIEKLNKRIVEAEKELNDANSKLKSTNDENERKNQIIHNLEMQLKTVGNASMSLRKQTPAGPVLKEESKVANLLRDSSTPPINPSALLQKQDEESPKQMMPPPDGEPENSLQKQKQDLLNMGIPEQIRSPQEKVGKPPLIRNDNKESALNQNNLEDGDKEPGAGAFLQKPNLDPPVKAASSASNNAAENPGILPPYPLVRHEKKEVVPVPLHKSKDYINEYDNNLAEDEGEVGYMENGNKNKDMNQHE